MSTRKNVICTSAPVLGIPVREVQQGDVFEVLTSTRPEQVGMVCISAYPVGQDYLYVALIDGDTWSGDAAWPGPTWRVRVLDRVVVARTEADIVGDVVQPAPEPEPEPGQVWVGPNGLGCTRITAAERECARVGKRIVAIKSIRQRLGIGLKDAKDLIDQEVPGA
jgi:hypothetical protein